MIITGVSLGRVVTPRTVVRVACVYTIGSGTTVWPDETGGPPSVSHRDLLASPFSGSPSLLLHVCLLFPYPLTLKKSDTPNGLRPSTVLGVRTVLIFVTSGRATGTEPVYPTIGVLKQQLLEI